MNAFNSDAVRNEIVSTITLKLNHLGIMFRIFSRSKSEQSIKAKLLADPEYGKSKKLQDLIGIRVILYFNDDIDTVRKILSAQYSENSSDVSIDTVKHDEFKALRYNIVYSLTDDHEQKLLLKSYVNRIDYTFELQIRTIFSEGWHEIEHDLRYKCKTEWDGFDLFSRRLNGVYASLETNEWTMIKIFDELAYSHYKNRNWSAMFRQKFRLRFIDTDIDSSILKIFKDPDIAKLFFRLDRTELIMDMNTKGFYYPININNIIYFANTTKINHPKIRSITPAILLEEMGG